MSLPHYRDFKAYCNSKGVHLLTDDIAHIDVSLKKYTTQETREILKNYVAEWIHGINHEGLVQKKQTAGRNRANQWLANHLAIPANFANPAKVDKNKTKSDKVEQMSLKAKAARDELLEMVKNW